MESLDSVNREGKERLYPSLKNPNWLVLRKRREIFRKWLMQVTGRDLIVLDIGGRIQPYRPLIQRRERAYMAVDLRRTPLVNVMARGERLPFGDASFDLAISTQVLEYIPEPAVFIAEIYRVLKPGGSLLLSVPSVCPSDAEEDSWRFLRAGLRRLLVQFESVEIVAEGGSITGFFRAINACLNIFARFSAVRGLLRYTLFPTINVMGLLAERMSGSLNEQFVANYSAWARKAGRPHP
jgi:SAM-dependent methyltransferase